MISNGVANLRQTKVEKIIYDPPYTYMKEIYLCNKEKYYAVAFIRPARGAYFILLLRISLENDER